MHQLIQEMFYVAFSGTPQSHDSAILDVPATQIALTTDSFVVRPLFFPGGNIGSLSIHGTVNDLAMSGAKPLWLTASFILEEGLPMETLWKIVTAMGAAAQEAQVQIVTGDTKVVERGHGDGIYINTSGVGVIHHTLSIKPQSVQPGDVILLSGDIGRHGMAVMSMREGFQFETQIESDSANLAPCVLALLEGGITIHCLRDCTRGGLATTLNEIAISSNLSFEIQEASVPVLNEVHGACEMLGLDPLYVANEGTFVALLPKKDSVKALSILKQFKPSLRSALIGQVKSLGPAPLVVENALGTRRIASLLSGEQLPRIC